MCRLRFRISSSIAALDEVEAIGNLYGLRSTLTTTFGVRAGAVTDDDLDAWMVAQPVREHLGRPVVEQVDGSVRFQVDQ